MSQHANKLAYPELYYYHLVSVEIVHKSTCPHKYEGNI